MIERWKRGKEESQGESIGKVPRHSFIHWYLIALISPTGYKCQAQIDLLLSSCDSSSLCFFVSINFRSSHSISFISVHHVLLTWRNSFASPYFEILFFRLMTFKIRRWFLFIAFLWIYSHLLILHPCYSGAFIFQKSFSLFGFDLFLDFILLCDFELCYNK